MRSYTFIGERHLVSVVILLNLTNFFLQGAGTFASGVYLGNVYI